MREIIGIQISFDVPERIAEQANAISKTLVQKYPAQYEAPTIFLEMAATLALLTSPVKAEREKGKANVKLWKYGKAPH